MEINFTDGTLKGKIKGIISDGMPTGTVLSFAGNTIPNNYLLCDGSAVSRSTYANLFNVIGTLYGTGDGVTTFNLPNLVERFVEGGSSSGTIKNAGLPNITGHLYMNRGTEGILSKGGALSPSYTTEERLGGHQGDHIYNCFPYIAFDASKSNSIYGSSDIVQPPAIVMKYIIKI